MLFFGPSFNHLIDMSFWLFFGKSMVFFLIKKCKFGMLNLGQVILGKPAGLVILIIIYVNLCNYLLSPRPGDNNLHVEVTHYQVVNSF